MLSVRTVYVLSSLHVPIAAHRIATPLTSMVLRCVVENEDTGIGIRATAQILEFCRDQKLGHRPRENRKSQMLTCEQRARSMQMKASFTLDTQSGDKSYAGQGAGRADRNRRPYLKDLAPQRRRGQAAGCVECSDILARIPHRVSRGPGRMDSMSFSRN